MPGDPASTEPVVPDSSPPAFSPFTSHYSASAAPRASFDVASLGIFDNPWASTADIGNAADSTAPNTTPSSRPPDLVFIPDSMMSADVARHPHFDPPKEPNACMYILNSKVQDTNGTAVYTISSGEDMAIIKRQETGTALALLSWSVAGKDAEIKYLAEGQMRDQRCDEWLPLKKDGTGSRRVDVGGGRSCNLTSSNGRDTLTELTSDGGTKTVCFAQKASGLPTRLEIRFETSDQAFVNQVRDAFITALVVSRVFSISIPPPRFHTSPPPIRKAVPGTATRRRRNKRNDISNTLCDCMCDCLSSWDGSDDGCGGCDGGCDCDGGDGGCDGGGDGGGGG
ncbi:unnamed protein product [Peniophora sp. CBMAI 1063]|nr:unnamed protein product [Peniophora sp. CBMAI 1063]